MNKQTKKTKVLISDFDGTISKVDFFYYVIDNLLSESDIKPWLDYQAGKVRHVEALSQIFSKIRLPQEELNKFILSLPMEECFVNTAKFCKENNIDFYIISAGADYYIRLILEALNVADSVNLISNRSFYSQEKGLNIEPDKTLPDYSIEYGINKKTAVESIKTKYDLCVFAGDGTPDLEPAKLADKVFARGRLLELCQESSIEATKFDSYCEILEYLKNE